MRLIDADMLKKYMLNNGKEVERFLQYIDEQPTVYNADKVIKTLEERIEFAGKMLVEKPADKLDEIANNTAEDFIAAYDEAIEIVKSGIIPGEKTRTTPWIMCSERLPENDMEEVLVWFEYFRYGEYNCLYRTIGTSHTYRGGWSGFVNGTSGWRDLRVIAWMPLPKPPEEDAQDD